MERERKEMVKVRSLITVTAGAAQTSYNRTNRRQNDSFVEKLKKGKDPIASAITIVSYLEHFKFRKAQI